jgi:hypothetical protein
MIRHSGAESLDLSNEPDLCVRNYSIVNGQHGQSEFGIARQQEKSRGKER